MDSKLVEEIEQEHEKVFARIVSCCGGSPYCELCEENISIVNILQRCLEEIKKVPEDGSVTMPRAAYNLVRCDCGKKIFR